MNKYNWKKHYAIWEAYKAKHDYVLEKPGIYVWERFDKDINKIYFYVGQAKNMLKRRFDYEKIITGLAYPTRHFEASLKAHKDWMWSIITYCNEDQLDDLEQYWIKEYMRRDNYITRNDMLTGNDIVKSNAKRMRKIEDNFENDVQKCLKHLDIKAISSGISIEMKRNKDGSFNKVSDNAFIELLERLGIKNVR